MSVTPPPTYEIYVDDDRYAVPTLHLVAAQDDDHARGIADRLLGENSHHLGAEVCIDDRVLFRVGSYALTPRATRSRHKDEPHFALERGQAGSAA